MDFLSVSTSPFSRQPLSLANQTPFLLFSSRKPSPETVAAPPLPPIVRRPLNLLSPNSNTNSNSDTTSAKPSLPSVNPLSSKLWLTSKLSPPPPKQEENKPLSQILGADPSVSTEEPKPAQEAQVAEPNLELRDKTKIFVGNIPSWVKKEEICRFFRQFGPLKKVELIRGHDNPEQNVG